MGLIPDDFAKVPLGTFNESACSPAVPSGSWDGVRIDAPRQITLDVGDPVMLPICGYYLVPVLSAMDDSRLIVELTRAADGKLLRGILHEEGENEPDEPPPDDAPELSRESLQGVSTGGYFNIDAQRYLAESLEPDRYAVVVIYAGMRSNPVQVEIIRR